MQFTTYSKVVLATTLTFSTFAKTHSQASYKLADNLSYENFFDAFDFFSGPDPTKGFVQYQNISSAIDQNLIGYFDNTQSIYMGVDSTQKDPRGRASVRLESKKSWNKGLLIADVYHMPPSECGIWPAYWLLGSNPETGEADWPTFGEIDILEGVNDHTQNAVTLHTSKGCIIDNTTSTNTNTSSPSSDSGNISPDTHHSPPSSFTGHLSTANCDVAAPNQSKNAGCSIKAPSTISAVQQTRSVTDNEKTIDSITLPSYGTQFNKARGGIYAMEYTSSYISVWFIPRVSDVYSTYFSSDNSNSNSTTTNDTTTPIPSDPMPNKWGPPIAYFAGAGCSFEERFRNLKIVFDTTFCGEWAGREWDDGGCKKKTGVETCEEYVRENPAVFEDAYWEVGGLKWYVLEGQGEEEGGGGGRRRREEKGSEEEG